MRISPLWVSTKWLGTHHQNQPEILLSRCLITNRGKRITATAVLSLTSSLKRHRECPNKFPTRWARRASLQTLVMSHSADSHGLVKSAATTFYSFIPASPHNHETSMHKYWSFWRRNPCHEPKTNIATAGSGTQGQGKISRSMRQTNMVTWAMLLFFALQLRLFVYAVALTVEGTVTTSQVGHRYSYQAEKNVFCSPFHQFITWILLQNWYLLEKLCFPESSYATLKYEFQFVRLLVSDDLYTSLWWTVETQPDCRRCTGLKSVVPHALGNLSLCPPM